MQVNRYITLPKSSLFSHKLFLMLRVFLLAGVTWYLWQAVLSNHKLLAGLLSTTVPLHPVNIILLAGVIVLLPVNWLLEALKWQLIAGSSHLGLPRALRGVILGVTLDNLLPAGTGAISGRVMTIGARERARVIPGILAGQVMQSAVTLVVGLYGFWFVWRQAAHLFTWPVPQVALAGTVVAAVLWAAYVWRGKLAAFLLPLRHYSGRLWGQLFMYSLARYGVFLLQFILLATVFSPATGLQATFACATWVFAARTFMPRVSNLERLGIRALAVVFFMGVLALPATGMLVAVILLWFVNIALPSVLGLFLYKKLSSGAG